MPSPNSALPNWGDMQGLILSAYPLLRFAEYRLLRIERDRIAQTRRWLAWIAGHVTTASERHGIAEQRGLRRLGVSPDINVNIAVSYTGLVKLRDLSGEARESFATEFREGIDGRTHRSRILGDTDNSEPARWTWGGKKDPVDVLLMVFAPDERQLADAIVNTELDTSGMIPVATLPAWPWPVRETDRKEHFGFRDGISQPILRGTPDAERYPQSRHLTELGEIVFGYPNTDGEIAWGPSLGEYPDLGLNGSYLVFRQLSQDVAKFWNFVFDKTSVGGRPDCEAAVRLASKIVGRDPAGIPQVPFGNVADNEFGFAQDPYGDGCPIGAHVRRANPRDSLGEHDPTLASANRHRVLRRGRPYGKPLDDRRQDEKNEDRGLLFLALNADFERQFEFIHQNWINNPAFAGMAHERDPLVGAHDAHACFTVQGLPAGIRIDGLSRFVTVKGGEYFFLPGIKALKYLAGQ